jgi:hypothetical protein
MFGSMIGVRGESRVSHTGHVDMTRLASRVQTSPSARGNYPADHGPQMREADVDWSIASVTDVEFDLELELTARSVALAEMLDRDRQQKLAAQGW